MLPLIVNGFVRRRVDVQGWDVRLSSLPIRDQLRYENSHYTPYVHTIQFLQL